MVSVVNRHDRGLAREMGVGREGFESENEFDRASRDSGLFVAWPSVKRVFGDEESGAED